MTSLREQNERMKAWMNEKPSFTDNSNELRWQNGDHPRVIFYFASNGNDGDQLIKVYRSHITPGIGKNGGRFSEAHYCPVQSGEAGVECPKCAAGHANVKERMSIWMYVIDMLHSIMPKDKNYPHVLVDGVPFFREEVNTWKIWHTSAWKDSPWGTINKLFELHGGLHKFVAQMETIGDSVDRRYPVYAIPESPAMPPDLYAQAKEVCTPIPQILKGQIGSPVAVNPVAAAPITAQVSPPIQLGAQPYIVPGQAIPAYSVSVPAPPAPPTPAPPAPPEPEAEMPIIQEEDNRRPMKSLF